MSSSDQFHTWSQFQKANRYRRAVRDFDSTPIASDDVYALLAEAALAPSSGNLQPYEFHWIRDPSLKASVASACNKQHAANSATELIVVVASPELGKQTATTRLKHVEGSSVLEPKSKDYYRNQIMKFNKILGFGSSALWTPLLFVATLIRPSLSLLPVGNIGSRHWAARNAIFAAQTLMLGAAAKGIDSCPMEGFSAPKVAELLGLPRGSVIPIVVALGYRATDARIEEQWRRPLESVVICR